MNRTGYILIVVAIVSLTIVSGVVQGRFSQRWGPSTDMAAAGKNLKEMPTKFGSWEMRSEEPLAEFVVQTLQCSGFVNRRYHNLDTGRSVHVAIYVGPPGPISAHRPEICYSSQDFETQDKTERVEIRSGDKVSGEFWAMTFRTNNVHQNPLRVYYAWSDGGRWQATESPRVTFGGGKLLYKIQLSAAAVAGEDLQQPEFDTCRTFLQDLLEAMPLAGETG